MTGRVVTLLTTLAAATSVLSSIGERPVPRFLWKRFAKRADRSLSAAPHRRADCHRTCRGPATRTDRDLPRRRQLSAAERADAEARAGAAWTDGPCREHRTITVDEIAMGVARERDSRGRPLPVWQGCRIVAVGEVLLMNWQSADSLDGRYFGLLPANAILGRAEPVWDRRGGVNMPQDARSSAIPLFGQNTDHSSVPAKVRIAIARSGRVQGGRQAGAPARLPLTAARTMAALRSLRVALCIVALLGGIDAVRRSGACRAIITNKTSSERPGG